MTAAPKISVNSALVIGDVLVDFQYWIDRLPASGEDTAILSARKHAGGSSSNSALGLRYLGVPCAFCSRVGRDAVGQQLEQMMLTSGLDLAAMQYMDETGYTLTMIEKDGERTMFSYRGLGSTPYKLTETLRAYLTQASLLLLSGYSLLDEPQALSVIEAAAVSKAAGNLIALDPSPVVCEINPPLWKKMLSLTDILLPNQSEAVAITGGGSVEEMLTAMSQLVPCAVIKSGGRGAVAYTRPGWGGLPEGSQAGCLIQRAPQKVVTPLDTTGAGDAFNAGFLAGIIRGNNLSDCLDLGNDLAGRVIQVQGGSTLYLEGMGLL